MASVTSKLPATKRASSKRAKAIATSAISPTNRARKPAGEFHAVKTSSPVATSRGVVLGYKSSLGVDAYLKQVHEATPVQMVEMERHGVAGTFITDLSKRMELPSSRVFAMLRIAPATAARKSAAGAVVDGRAGLAAIGMIKLLGIAQDIIEDSTSTEAEGFDTVKWLGQWIERPQPALGGHKPADYLDTPTGVEIVAQLLGAMRSGAYL
jgi:putative toxin-antitoxin system antitoxin component (TIGR02293 family)